MAIRNLAYELTIGGAGVAPNVAKGLFGTASGVEKLDARAKSLRETLIGQNAELKQMRAAGLQGTEAYEKLQESANATKSELGDVGQALRKAQHEQRAATQTQRQHTAMMVKGAAVIAAVTTAYTLLSAAVLGVARQQREIGQEARAAGVTFYDYTRQVHANTLALDGNKAAGRAAAGGLIEAARQARQFAVGLGEIDTTNLAVAGVNLREYLAAARDPSGAKLAQFLRQQYREIDRIGDATQRQIRLDALRQAVGPAVFALAAKQAGMTEEQIRLDQRAAEEAARLAQERQATFDRLNKTLAGTSLAFANVGINVAGIFAPSLEMAFGLINKLLGKVNEWIAGNETAARTIGIVGGAALIGIGILGGLSLAIGATRFAVGQLTTAYNVLRISKLKDMAVTVTKAAVTKAAAVGMGIMTAAQWALNVALTANPIGIVIVAIGALIGGLVLAYKKSETFRNIVKSVWELLKKHPLAYLIRWVIKAVDWIGKLTGKIEWVGKAWGKVKGFFGGEPEKVVANTQAGVEATQAAINQAGGPAPGAPYGVDPAALSKAMGQGGQAPAAAPSIGSGNMADYGYQAPPGMAPGAGAGNRFDYGGNTFYITIEGVAGEGLTPEEAGRKTVEEIDRLLQQTTAAH